MVTLETVIRAHGTALLSYATRLTGDRDLAEDVLQETWLRAWRHLDRLTEDVGSVRGWLMRVAHNIAIDLHRRRRARPVEVELPEHDLESIAMVSSPDDEVEARLDIDAVLDRLSEVQRHTLVAVYFADRTATSAATVLGVPVGTVKSRVHKALRTLRDTFPPPFVTAA